MLQQSGYYVDSNSTQDELLSDALKGVRDSSRFRIYLEQYLKKANEMSSFSGMDGNYSNFNLKETLKSTFCKKEGGSAAGNALRENIGPLIGAGIGALSTKLADSSAKKGNEQAIQFEKEKANTAAQEAKKLELQNEATRLAQGSANTPSSVTPTSSGTPKWVMPVAIGGGVLVLGTILFFVFRKKK
jgi:hypothetical protein